MGQPITVAEKPSSTPGVVRFEVNRSLTGMGHERYAAGDVLDGERPVDELARRLFARGGIDHVHVNSSIITVDVSKGYEADGLADIIRGLFLHYDPAAVPAAGAAAVHEGTDADHAESAAAPEDLPAATNAEEPPAPAET
jgi:hypothetical protein